MYVVAAVYKIGTTQDPSGAELKGNLYTDYASFEHINESLELVNVLNQTYARYDTTKTLLGYVVYNTSMPFYNIIGISNTGEIKKTIELQPLPVAKMAVDFFNDNNPITKEKASISYTDPIRYAYFIPKGLGE